MYQKGRQGRHVTPLDSVLNVIRSQMGKEKILKIQKKIKKFAILPSFLSETVFFNSFCWTAATNYDAFLDSGSEN